MNGKGLWGMNMMIGLSVLGGTWYVAQTNVFAVKAYLFSFSPRFTESAKKHIIDYTKQGLISTVSSPALLSAAIMQQFSCVKKVAAQLLPSGTMHVVVDAVEPVVCINDNYLLAAESDCVLKDLFVPSSTQQLPTIMCSLKSEFDIPMALHHCKEKFSYALCSTYDVVWHDEYCIRLQDKQEPKFSIMCSAQFIPDEACLLHCEQLKKTVLQASDARKAARDKRWIADVRFNNQIVVYAEKKGVGYG